jgi:hypothetical protein
VTATSKPRCPPRYGVCGLWPSYLHRSHFLRLAATTGSTAHQWLPHSAEHCAHALAPLLAQPVLHALKGIGFHPAHEGLVDRLPGRKSSKAIAARHSPFAIRSSRRLPSPGARSAPVSLEIPLDVRKDLPPRSTRHRSGQCCREELNRADGPQCSHSVCWRSGALQAPWTAIA